MCRRHKILVPKFTLLIPLPLMQVCEEILVLIT